MLLSDGVPTPGPTNEDNECLWDWWKESLNITVNIDQATQLDCGKALVLLCEEKIYILVMLIAPTGID